MITYLLHNIILQDYNTKISSQHTYDNRHEILKNDVICKLSVFATLLNSHDVINMKEATFWTLLLMKKQKMWQLAI